MAKKRIVHLIQSLDAGGCEKFLLRLLPIVEGYDHRIITLSHEGSLASEFRDANIPVYTINQRSVFDISAYIRLLNVLKEYQPDLLLTYLFHADMIARFIIQPFVRYPVIPWLRTTYNYPRYTIARFLEKVSTPFVYHYIANSEAVKSFYIFHYGISNHNITVIPNGIDPKLYMNTVVPQSKKDALGITTEDNIICVANLHKNKGLQYLLEAFEGIYKTQKNISLLVVGDGNQQETLQRQIVSYTSKANIYFLGKRHDIPALLAISKIFVLPTLFEGMSNAIMEAMASGLGIITTNIEENREIIQHGESGLLVQTKNSYEIRVAIQKLLSDTRLRELLANNAKRVIQTDFSLDKIAQRFTVTLNRLQQ